MSQPIERALARFAGAVVDASQRHARAVVVAGLLLTLAAGFAASHLVADSDPDRMTAADLPFRVTKRQIETEFPMLRDSFVIVVEATRGEHAREAAGTLARRLAEDGERFRAVAAPTSDPFFERNAWLYLPEAAFEAALRSLREGASPEPRSPPARQILLAQPALDEDGLAPALDAIAAVRTAAAALPERDGLRVRVTGDLAVLTEEMSEIRDQVLVASLVSVLLVTAVLILTLRSFRLFLATLLLLLVGLVWTAGFAALAVGRLNVLTTAFAVLYIGLGVDFGIHFALGFRERRERGAAPDVALREAGRDVGSSLAFCALTTATGFFAFVPTDYTAVAELGLISGTGMFLSLLATLTWYPATLALGLGRSTRLDPRTGARREITLPSFPLRHPGAVIAAAVLLCGVGAGFARDVRFDDNPLNVRDPRVESVAALEELLADPALSPWTAEALASGPRAARELAQALEALPEVAHAHTVHDLLPPDQERRLARIASLPEAVRQQLAPGLPKTALAFEDLPESLRSRYLSRSGIARVEIFPSEDLTAPGALARFADAVRRVAPDASGAAVGTVEFARAITRALKQALATAVAVILVLLLLLWRSPRDAMITLAPLAFGTLTIVAFAGALGLPFNFANVIVLPLLLGIGVDSGIHLVHRHRLALGADANLLETSTARAVLFSALTTGLSFATICFASHGGIASLALLLTVGIGVMLAANLLLLPALVARFGKRER